MTNNTSYLAVISIFLLFSPLSSPRKWLTDSTNLVGVMWLEGVSISIRAKFWHSAKDLPHDQASLITVLLSLLQWKSSIIAFLIHYLHRSSEGCSFFLVPLNLSKQYRARWLPSAEAFGSLKSSTKISFTEALLRILTPTANKLIKPRSLMWQLTCSCWADIFFSYIYILLFFLRDMFTNTHNSNVT